MTYEEMKERIKGKVIVSCQALPGEPLYCEERTVMDLMARAAKQAGSPAIRANSVRDILAIKKETGLPIFGIIKIDYPGYEAYITPTMKEVDQLHEISVEVIAMDCTGRRRGDGKTPYEFIREVRKRYPDQMIMADISTYEEGVLSARAGVHFVSTTMSGYTDYSPKADGPDTELIVRLSRALDIPVIGEGKIHSPEDAASVLKSGAFAAVVGGAITRPLEIARRFMMAVGDAGL